MQEGKMSEQTPAAEPAPVDYKKLFTEIKTIAVVGYSDNPERAGHYVAQYLASQGYNIIAVNPRFKGEVDGLKCYPSLEAIPGGTRIDVIDVYRSPEAVPPLVAQAAKLDPLPKYFWMQPGAENPDAAALARERGMIPIMHACMMAAHKIWM
jgi:hypothetical protein